MKKFKKFIIPALIILLVIILLIIFLRPKHVSLNSDANKLENLAGGSAQAQSYSTSKVPAFKKDDMIFGDKNAALKIFVYEDNSSLYSAQLADTLDKLNVDFPDKLAIIVRPFVAKKNNLAAESALAIECAGDQGKWTAMRALLFAKAKNSNVNEAEFGAYATEIGLDQNTFTACLTNNEKSAKIEGLSAEAETYNVQGAPTIFIGDEMILGARPYEDYVDSNGDNIEGMKTVVEKKLQ
ncbi:MAG: thioredoxin domain-containing protein [Patescibacteria group bacterium]